MVLSTSWVALLRNSAHSLEYGAQRPEEDFLFDHHLGVTADGFVEEVTYYEIPDACVRDTKKYTFRLRRDGTVNGPAEHFEKPSTKFSPHSFALLS